jgi:hypothetical protein
MNTDDKVRWGQIIAKVFSGKHPSYDTYEAALEGISIAVEKERMVILTQGRYDWRESPFETCEDKWKVFLDWIESRGKELK